MPAQKKQHYVPKFYLKNFTNLSKRICIYVCKTGKIFEDISYKEQCQQDYFYGEDCCLEQTLQNKETFWGNTLKKILNTEHLDSSDIGNVKSFAIYQRLRTKDIVEYENSQRKETLEIVNSMQEDIAQAIPFIPTTSTECMEYINVIENSINDLQLLVINYKTKLKLVTSDSPVIIINPFTDNLGFTMMGIIIYFPVSPDKLIVLYDAKIYTKFKDKTYINSSNEKEVEELNNTQFLSSDDIIISSTVNEFSKFNNKIKNLKVRVLEKNKIKPLGSSKSKIIPHSPKKIITKYNFSFAQLPKILQQIPLNCREALPRKYNKDWEDKLLIKPQILSAIWQAHKIPGISNKKLLNKFCKQMILFAKKYWAK